MPSQPPGAHLAQVGGAALRSAGAAAAIDVRDPLVAEPDKVVEHQPGSVRLVDQHAVGIGVAQPASHDHARRLGRGGGDVAGGHARADKDQPADAVLEQRGEGGALAPGRPAAGGEQQLVAELRRELLDAAGDLREERVAQVVEDHADRLGPLAGEAARHRVRSVAESRRGVEHAQAALLADVRPLAHDQRDQRARHPGFARDVFHGGGASSQGMRRGAARRVWHGAWTLLRARQHCNRVSALYRSRHVVDGAFLPSGP